MIEIDGSDGGGQILRYALAASASTGIGFTIEDIRGDRPDPGLKPQHLTAVETVAMLCDADVDGCQKGSRDLSFEPHTLEATDCTVDIGTAGSVSLLFQCIGPLSYHIDEPFHVRAEGGTDVKWSPPIDYMEHIMTRIGAMFGASIDVTTSRRGFYPKGGGIAGLDVSPGEPETQFLTDPGSVQRIRGYSVATHQLKDARVANRQRSEVRRRLRNVFPSGVEIDIDVSYVQSRSPGSSITLVAETEESWIGADALGERGKQSEEVGAQAAQALLETLEAGAAVDTHMADQIIPYLAEAGGRVCIPERTDHVETAVSLLDRFYERTLSIMEDDGRLFVVAD